MELLFSKSSPFINIKKDLCTNTLCHAYLFSSSDGLNNSIFVNEIAKLIVCDNKNACNSCPSCLKASAQSHPDILKYPKNKSFIVEDANDINTKAYEKPLLSEKKIIIIENIDEATIQSQNKILKTLEEPPKSVIFLLTARNENKILPTISSRVRKVKLSPVDKQTLKDYIVNNNLCNNLLTIETAINFGEGWLGKTLNIVNNPLFQSERATAEEILKSFTSSKNLINISSQILNYREDIKSFFEILSKEFRNSLITQNNEGIIKIIESINLASQSLERNVNISLIIDNLLMKILEIKYLYKINQ